MTLNILRNELFAKKGLPQPLFILINPAAYPDLSGLSNLYSSDSKWQQPLSYFCLICLRPVFYRKTVSGLCPVHFSRLYYRAFKLRLIYSVRRKLGFQAKAMPVTVHRALFSV